MLNFIDIFNINSTVSPINRDEIENGFFSEVSNGFVLCNYNELITTIKEINSSNVYDISTNSDELFKTVNNPGSPVNVAMIIEGIRYNNKHYSDKAIINVEEKDLASFESYSVFFKSEIKNLKNAIFKKLLWNYECVDAWFNNSNVKLTLSSKEKIIDDYDFFNKYILNTSDYIDFINCQDKTVKDNVIKALRKYIKPILDKYRHEIVMHFNNITDNELSIKIKNPIISKIYVINNVANICKKEWPKLPIIGIDRKSFENLLLFKKV